MVRRLILEAARVIPDGVTSLPLKAPAALSTESVLETASSPLLESALG